MEPATLETPPEASPFAEAAAASAALDDSRVETLRSYEETLPVPMTDEERLAHGDALVAAMRSVDVVKADTAAEKARHKVEMDSLSDRLDEALGVAGKLARELGARAIDKLVPCREEKVFATGAIRTVRLDTGETVRERAMNKHERQADLFAGAGEGDDETCRACGKADCTIPAVADGEGGWKHGGLDAPESFSRLAEDSDAPEAITVRGEVTTIYTGCEFDFEIALEGFGTRVRVRDEDGSKVFAVRDHVEMVGAYADSGDDTDSPAFVAGQIQVFDAETAIDATKMATVGEVVETKKKRGKGKKS